MTELTEAGFVEDIVVHDDAEDVTRVEIRGDQDTVGFAVTDESMAEFLEVAEQVFDDIHADMAEMRDIIEQAPKDLGGLGRSEGLGATENRANGSERWDRPIQLPGDKDVFCCASRLAHPPGLPANRAALPVGFTNRVVRFNSNEHSPR